MKNIKRPLAEELPGQICFQGAARTYANRYRNYELEKKQLQEVCTSYEEYEQAVRRLAVKYRI